MTGSVLVPADSQMKSLADLAGKRLGVAGGPQDKSWLLLRALGLRRHGVDLEKVAVPVYGAPPLLAQQMETGRLDALLTFWPQAVPLEARGYRRLVEVGGIAAELGITHAPPLVGWIMHRSWAEAHKAEVDAFRAAERETRAAMCGPGFDWRGLDRLTRAADDAIRAGLAAGFCAAVPTDAGDGADADRMFALLAQLGGEELTGPSLQLQPGVFW
jgi:NitT/TauT family transport system substrate-binding protein